MLREILLLLQDKGQTSPSSDIIISRWVVRTRVQVVKQLFKFVASHIQEFRPFGCPSKFSTIISYFSLLTVQHMESKRCEKLFQNWK